jgi:hypothetical protein
MSVAAAGCDLSEISDDFDCAKASINDKKNAMMKASERERTSTSLPKSGDTITQNSLSSL